VKSRDKRRERDLESKKGKKSEVRKVSVKVKVDILTAAIKVE